MSTICTITQPGQLPILRKPAPSKIHDPIFKRRRHPYDSEERSYIRSLIPLNALPPSLRPTSRNRRPPVMHFGWIINETAKSRLLEKARQTPGCYIEEETSGGDECFGLCCPPGPHTHIDEYYTMDVAADVILQELGITLPQGDFVFAIFTADESMAFCFTLYTNYALDKTLPSKDDIERIRKHLGLDGSPQWWPDMHFQWVEC